METRLRKLTFRLFPVLTDLPKPGIMLPWGELAAGAVLLAMLLHR